MKREELMINDWVSLDGEPIQVAGLQGRKVGVHKRRRSIYCSWHLDSEFQPITLTEEILVKNGFVYREEEETCATNAFHHWKLDGHSFALDYTQYFRKEKKDDMPRFDVAGIAIHYVHQLQHLLRLAGIDKEIEL